MSSMADRRDTMAPSSFSEFEPSASVVLVTISTAWGWGGMFCGWIRNEAESYVVTD